MFKACLVPTVYEQPRPVDGIYPAIVYPTYAEFDYQGFKVKASTPNATMNADGKVGQVIVNGTDIEIKW